MSEPFEPGPSHDDLEQYFAAEMANQEQAHQLAIQLFGREFTDPTRDNLVGRQNWYDSLEPDDLDLSSMDAVQLWSEDDEGDVFPEHRMPETQPLVNTLFDIYAQRVEGDEVIDLELLLPPQPPAQLIPIAALRKIPRVIVEDKEKQLPLGYQLVLQRESPTEPVTTIYLSRWNDDNKQFDLACYVSLDAHIATAVTDRIRIVSPQTIWQSGVAGNLPALQELYLVVSELLNPPVPEVS